MPELPLEKKNRFVTAYGLSEYDAGVLTATIEMARYFERVAELSAAPKPAANWVTQGLTREINTRGLSIESAADFPVTAERLAELVKAVEQGTISKTIGDTVLSEMIDGKNSAAEIIAAKGLAQVSDTAALERMVDEALAANPGPVADYRAGKKQALGRIMGSSSRTWRKACSAASKCFWRSASSPRMKKTLMCSSFLVLSASAFSMASSASFQRRRRMDICAMAR